MQGPEAWHARVLRALEAASGWSKSRKQSRQGGMCLLVGLTQNFGQVRLGAATMRMPESTTLLLSYTRCMCLWMKFTTTQAARYEVEEGMPEHGDDNLPGHTWRFVSVLGSFKGRQLWVQNHGLLAGTGTAVFDGARHHSVHPIQAGVRFSIVTYAKHFWRTPAAAEGGEHLDRLGFPLPPRQVQEQALPGFDSIVSRASVTQKLALSLSWRDGISKGGF